uniref:Uncharacterized protein n=1 Tax=Sphaerodactylus townsendi TaxID=933632 RepID=A0ACB8FXS4_9SAUR
MFFSSKCLNSQGRLFPSCPAYGFFLLGYSKDWAVGQSGRSPVIPTSPTNSSTTPTSTMGMSSKIDSSTLQDVFILSPMSGLYGPRDEIGIMSCDDISKYGVGKTGMKGSESPSYFLEHESGKYYTLIEGEGHPASSEYERGRATGVRRREKTPTHGRALLALAFCSDSCFLSRIYRLIRS